MTFLQPLLLWGLLAAAIPVIIHLLNRWRHRTVRWAAMQFLLKATRESRGKKRLKHLLILACRTLAVATLAVAAARPLLGGFLGWGAGQIDTVVLILDRSASMEARPAGASTPRRAIALEQVSAALAELGSVRLVLLDSAGGDPQEVPAPDVLPQLSATAPTDTAADIPALLERAAEFLNEGSPGRTEVWIASDLQSEDWKPRSERWQTACAALAALPQPPPLRLLALTGKPAPNTSLSVLACRRAAAQLEIEFELLRHDDARTAADLPLTLAIDGVRTTDTVTLRGDSQRFVRRIALPEGSAEGSGWASIPPDGNPRDNSAFFAFGPARPLRTAVVAEPGEAADYLALAAAPPGLPGREALPVTPADASALRWNELAAVLWAAPLPAGPTAARAARFLTEGGALLFLPPGEAAGAEFGGVSWGAPEDAAAGKFLIVGEADRDDGLLRDGLDGTPLNTGALRAIRRQPILGEAAVLARWDDNSPLLARRASERGIAWFLGTLPDYRWSNLADGDLLLPAVHRAVTSGAERFDAGHLAEVGSQAARALPGQARARIDDFAAPDPANADFEAGVWRIDERLVAANRPPAENLVEQLPQETLERLLADVDHSLFREARTAAPEALAREAWRAFLVAMLLFLIAEAILCLPASRRRPPATQPAAA